jgi:hypothetical protein
MRSDSREDIRELPERQKVGDRWEFNDPNQLVERDKTRA